MVVVNRCNVVVTTTMAARPNTTTIGASSAAGSTISAVSGVRTMNTCAPPRGYQWVQSGGDFILVAIATGVILQLLLGS